MSILPTNGAPKQFDELVDLIAKDNKVKVAGIDIDGILRGKFMSINKFKSAAKSSFGFCSVIFGWDGFSDKTYFRELTISNRENGYGDINAVVDWATYRRLPWEKDSPFFLVSFKDPKTGKPLHACPRSTLELVMKRIRSETGDEWEGMAGAEFEYFQFKETAQSAADKNFANLIPLTPGMHGYSMLRPTLNQDYFHELYDAAEAFGIEVEGHHTETGPGVFETALGYTQAQRMADNAVLFKLVAKSVGMKYGIMPTFMAKPWADLPGCSGHIHVSIKDKSGKNIFALSPEEIAGGGRKEAPFKDVQYISQIGEYFLAGVLEGLPDVMPMLCPTINSYKRLVGGEEFWAPNLASYGFDSRVASIRIIGPPDTPDYATRFEIRVPGADMVAHLAFSAIFALGLRGIQKKLALPYGPIGAPGVTKDSLPKLATTLEAATERFMAPESIAREVFGDLFVEHLGGTRQHEVEMFKRTVTHWEVARYLELA